MEEQIEVTIVISGYHDNQCVFLDTDKISLKNLRNVIAEDGIDVPTSFSFLTSLGNKVAHKQQDKITVSSYKNSGYVIKLRPDQDVLNHLPHEKDQTKTDVYIHEHIPDQFSENYPSSSTADLEESTQGKGTVVGNMVCTDEPTPVVDYEESMNSEALSESDIEIFQEISASKSDTNEPPIKKPKHDSVLENSVVTDLTNSTRVLENKASKDVPKMNNLQFVANSIASKEKEETGASLKYVVHITGKKVSVKCSVCCKTFDGGLPAQKLQSLLKHVRSSEHLMNVGNQNQAFLEKLDKDKISLLEEQNYMKFFFLSKFYSARKSTQILQIITINTYM